MNKGQNLHLRRCHFVDEAVTLDEELSDSRLVEFRNDPTAFAEGGPRPAPPRAERRAYNLRQIFRPGAPP